jgi:hypothetical protein
LWTSVHERRIPDSELYSLWLPSAGTVEIRVFLHVFPPGLGLPTVLEKGEGAVGEFSRLFYQISYEEKPKISVRIMTLTGI